MEKKILFSNIFNCYILLEEGCKYFRSSSVKKKKKQIVLLGVGKVMKIKLHV